MRFDLIVDAYWEGRTRAEADSIKEVHAFLLSLVQNAGFDTEASEDAACSHPAVPGNVRCTLCTERAVEGALSTALVGILDRVTGHRTPARRRDHPFFLGELIKNFR